VNIAHFVTLLTNSRLLTKPDADQAAAAFQESCRSLSKEPSVQTLCDFLVATNRVTRWQCDNLCAGRWKGFFLDDYLLLEHVGRDNVSTSYKARDLRDGNIVRMVVRPLNKTEGRLDYRIEPYDQ
jgi:hypothetical protein